MKQIVTLLHLYKRRGILSLFLAFLIPLMVTATIASAHAVLVKSEPENGAALEQPPQQVIAWFGQELESRSSSIQVFNTDGRQIDNGDGGVDLYDPDHTSMIATLPDNLSNGTYTAHWSVVSVEDGDSEEGEFYFGVGETPSTPAQTTAAQTASSNDINGWPMGELILSIGILALVVVAVILYPQLKRED